MRVIRFLKALFRYIFYGKKVSFVDYVSRLDACCRCTAFGSDTNADKWTCGVCGCYVTKKAKMSTEKCPHDKW